MPGPLMKPETSRQTPSGPCAPDANDRLPVGAAPREPPKSHSSSTVAVVLAAGLGTRMRSATPKVLHRLCGRPMLDYVLDAWESTADGAASGRPVVVYSPAVEAITEVFAERGTFALQDAPRGTGDAVRAALEAVPADATEILVLSGDVPLVTGSDLDAVLEARRQDDAAIALASVFAAEPGEPRADRARRLRDSRADRRGERRDRRRARRQRGQRRASTPSTRPGCAVGSARSSPRRRPASCT